MPAKARSPRPTRSEVATTGGLERDDGLDDGLDDAVGEDLHQARPSRHDPRLHVSPRDADPWAQLAALPRHDVRPEIGDDRGRAAVDFSLLDDQVLDRDPDREPVAGGGLVADELAVEGDFTVEADLGDDGAGWWGR